jgi:hypothetical protein
MRPPRYRRPLFGGPLARAAAWLAGTRVSAALARSTRRAADRGTTAIEWAIFALLAIAIAGLVAAAITAAVNNRLPGIQ